jgi:hypothetical protein
MFAAIACASSPRKPLPHPIILSYFWPVEKGSHDFHNWNMDTPNVIDILSDPEHGNEEVRQYWSNKGKILLNRVYPLKFKGQPGLLYDQFAENMKKADGVSVDELLDTGLSRSEIAAFIDVLRKVRENYPDKYIFVWGGAVWSDDGVALLRAIRDYADIFIPELYISEQAQGWSPIIKARVEKMEKQAPGILRKTLFGMGIFGKMGNLGAQSFRDHMATQIRFFKTDPLLRELPGIAIIAPSYLPKEDQKYLDNLIKLNY